MSVSLRGGAGYGVKRFFLMRGKRRPLPRPFGKCGARLVVFAHAPTKNALLLKRFQRGGNRSVFSRKLCNAQIALLERLQHKLLLDGALARLEPICLGSARHPTLIDLRNHRPRHLPGAVDALHARYAPRWHEQAYARRKRRKITIRQELRTLSTDFGETGFAQHLFYGFELRKI